MMQEPQLSVKHSAGEDFIVPRNTVYVCLIHQLSDEEWAADFSYYHSY